MQINPSFSKVGGNYHLDLKIIWSSDIVYVYAPCGPLIGESINL
jgi:hypothetical protein